VASSFPLLLSTGRDSSFSCFFRLVAAPSSQLVPQCAVLCRAITQAWRRGRVDAVVQSTDKNFLVPVSRRQPRGGRPFSGHPASSKRSLIRTVRFVCFIRFSPCLVLMPSAVPVCPVHRPCLPCCSFEAACPLVISSLVIPSQVGGAVIAAGSRACSLVEAVNRLYPGRASLSPLLDVFITLLSLGAKGGPLPDLRLLHFERFVYTRLVASPVTCGRQECIFCFGLGTHCAELKPAERDFCLASKQPEVR
jgi:hypothetical protein